ncbi:MAG: phosphotransferase [Bacteroidales bacterium]|nr:phosphotransferase [Bacteroidales bacterium]
MKSFVEGKILKELTPPLIELAGRELGRLHKIEAPEYLPRKLSYGREQFGQVEKYAANTGFERWLRQKHEYFSPYLSPDLPRAFIHGDVFCDNVIVSEDDRSVAILDFEESAFYYRIFDIGMMIIGTCPEGQAVDFKKAGALLKGYLQEISLLDLEEQYLQAFTVYAGAAMTFWRHRNFNYSRPDSGLADHYLGLKVLTDFVEQQDAGDFLNRVLP